VVSSGRGREVDLLLLRPNIILPAGVIDIILKEIRRGEERRGEEKGTIGLRREGMGRIRKGNDRERNEMK
jgi:hypothetical protein